MAFQVSTLDRVPLVSIPGMRARSLWTTRSDCWPCICHGDVPRQPIITALQRRTIFLDSLPTVLLPPVVFAGLFITLWIYKCMMMVLFQDKIIYMPYVPPFSRSEKVDDYISKCKPVEWESIHIRSLDGVKLALCIGHIPKHETINHTGQHIVICYFQGNASSLPPRLPMLSTVLNLITDRQKTSAHPKIRYTVVALSYRGYWTSSGRASQNGIELDAQALLKWVHDQYTSYGTNLQVILWGQSIGAGVASTAAATYMSQITDSQRPPIAGIILETPFSNIKSMLSAIYPQRWLPYGYLWPFLWNHWDSDTALRRIAQHGKSPRILLLSAEKDEIVPASEANKLELLCRSHSLDMVRENVAGALHTEATFRRAGQDAVTNFVVGIANSIGS